MRRLGLLVFGAAFAALFVVLAVAEGIGNPSIPDGDVVLIDDAPGDSGQIGKAEFVHALFLAGVENGLDRAPRPSDEQYEESKETALASLIESAWVEGEATEMGVAVSDSMVSGELEKILRQRFPTQAARWRFLVQSKFTQEDLERQVKISILGSRIQKQIEASGSNDPLTVFLANYYGKWTSRTFCAEGYVTEKCANFTGNGHPVGAPAACYEKDPEEGLLEECPAPVFQRIPAVPGSVTPRAPQGDLLPQRPIPPAER